MVSIGATIAVPGAVMKVTLDLTDLVARGALTQAEADRLRGLAAEDTGSLGINIVLAFGIVAVTLGAAAFVPNAVAATGLGAVLFAVGLGFRIAGGARWDLLGTICLSIGALALTGGISYLFSGQPWVDIVLALVLGIAAVPARSGLLAAIAVLTLSAGLSGLTSNWPQSALTIVVLSALTLVLYIASLRVGPSNERLALIAARTAILLVNAAFWIGSIWGDGAFGISSQVFSVLWAAALVAMGAWAVSATRRWVVNMAAIFGAIHFFTQWFILLGPNPLTILGAGLLLLGFGTVLYSLNRRFLARRSAAGA